MGNATLENSGTTYTTIWNNTATSDGGGIANEAASSSRVGILTIRAGTQIFSNGAANGGAISDWGGVVNINGSAANPVYVLENSVSGNGGGVYETANGLQNPTITCYGLNMGLNTAQGLGGGFYVAANAAVTFVGATSPSTLGGDWDQPGATRSDDLWVDSAHGATYVFNAAAGDNPGTIITT